MQPVSPVILDDGKELSPSDSKSDSDSESDAPCQATEDEDYFMNLVTFKVEDRLFRVPSYRFFQESPEFSEKYKLSAHPCADGGDPIKLEMVTQKDFRTLLNVLYPSPLFLPTNHRLSLSPDEWVVVLILASQWKFLRVREMAKSALASRYCLTFLARINLGRVLSIPSWVVSGFVGLVQATTITDKEALEIDSDAETTAYKLFRIRELRIAGELSCVETKVEEIFKEELDRLRTKEETFRVSNTNRVVVNHILRSQVV